MQKRQFKKRKQRRVLKGGADFATGETFNVKQLDGVEIEVKRFQADGPVLNKIKNGFTITLDENIFTGKLAESNASRQLKGLENRFPLQMVFLLIKMGKK